MSSAVITCMKICKPLTKLTNGYFSELTPAIITLIELHQRMVDVINSIEISGSCESAIDEINSYSEALISFARSSTSRAVRTNHILIFTWTPLFLEDERCKDVESSTCIWFEVAMTYVVRGQLYYSLGVEYLVNYEEDETKDENLKISASYFSNAAYMFSQARSMTQRYWKTIPREFDPVVRKSVFVEFWEKLCLAAAQHCYINKYMKIVEVDEQNSVKHKTLAKLVMGEANLYERVLTVMREEGMYKHMKQLYSHVAQLYVNNISLAYSEHLRSIETTEKNIWDKILALEKLKEALTKQAPEIPCQMIDDELRKLNISIGSVYFIKRGNQTLVPRGMIPDILINVKAKPV